MSPESWFVFVVFLGGQEWVREAGFPSTLTVWSRFDHRRRDGTSYKPPTAGRRRIYLVLVFLCDCALPPPTVLIRPNLHVTRHRGKKVFFFIRLKSKENFSAISARNFPKKMKSWSY